MVLKKNEAEYVENGGLFIMLQWMRTDIAYLYVMLFETRQLKILIPMNLLFGICI